MVFHERTPPSVGIILIIFRQKVGHRWESNNGALAIIFGFILVANYSIPGTGLALIWAAAVMALLGGIAMIFQAFRGRTA